MNFNGQLMMSSPGALTIQSGGAAEGLVWSSQKAFIDYNQDGEGGKAKVLIEKTLPMESK